MTKFNKIAKDARAVEAAREALRQKNHRGWFPVQLYGVTVYKNRAAALAAAKAVDRISGMLVPTFSGGSEGYRVVMTHCYKGYSHTLYFVIL